MKEVYNQEFESIEFGYQLPLAHYEACTFINCDLSESNLKEQVFMESTFRSCNLSSAQIAMSSWKDVSFENCKLMGLSFENVNPFLFEISCKDCQLDFCSFHGMELKNMKFSNTSFVESDFSNADLSQTVFENCNFHNAQFDQTKLEETDLRTSHGFQINPATNQLIKTRFSRNNVEGLLHSLNIIIE